MKIVIHTNLFSMNQLFKAFLVLILSTYICQKATCEVFPTEIYNDTIQIFPAAISTTYNTDLDFQIPLRGFPDGESYYHYFLPSNIDDNGSYFSFTDFDAGSVGWFQLAIFNCTRSTCGQYTTILPNSIMVSYFTDTFNENVQSKNPWFTRYGFFVAIRLKNEIQYNDPNIGMLVTAVKGMSQPRLPSSSSR